MKRKINIELTNKEWCTLYNALINYDGEVLETIKRCSDFDNVTDFYKKIHRDNLKVRGILRKVLIEEKGK